MAVPAEFWRVAAAAAAHGVVLLWMAVAAAGVWVAATAVFMCVAAAQVYQSLQRQKQQQKRMDDLWLAQYGNCSIHRTSRSSRHDHNTYSSTQCSSDDSSPHDSVGDDSWLVVERMQQQQGSRESCSEEKPNPLRAAATAATASSAESTCASNKDSSSSSRCCCSIPRVYLVVLGDLARSPRMLYHAQALTTPATTAANGQQPQETAAFPLAPTSPDPALPPIVHILAYTETPLPTWLKDSCFLVVHTLPPFPLQICCPAAAAAGFPLSLLLLLLLPLKLLHQATALAVALMLTLSTQQQRQHLKQEQEQQTISPVVIVQSPPALPTVGICALICRWRHHARLLIDWHNFAYTLLFPPAPERLNSSISESAEEAEAEDEAAAATTSADRTSASAEWSVFPGLISSREGALNHAAIANVARSSGADEHIRKSSSSGTEQGFVRRVQAFLCKVAENAEGLGGRYAHGNLCVSSTMQQQLQQKWGVFAAVMYDRPAVALRPINLLEKHLLAMKYMRLPESLSSSQLRQQRRQHPQRTQLQQWLSSSGATDLKLLQQQSQQQQHAENETTELQQFIPFIEDLDSEGSGAIPSPLTASQLLSPLNNLAGAKKHEQQLPHLHLPLTHLQLRCSLPADAVCSLPETGHYIRVADTAAADTEGSRCFSGAAANMKEYSLITAAHLAEDRVNSAETVKKKSKDSRDNGKRLIATVRMRRGRPAVLVASTSWTADEQNYLLLHAVQLYDRQREWQLRTLRGGADHLKSDDSYLNRQTFSRMHSFNGSGSKCSLRRSSCETCSDCKNSATCPQAVADESDTEDYTLFSELDHKELLPPLLLLVSGRGGHEKGRWLQQAAAARLRHVAIRTLFAPLEDYYKLIAAADIGICVHSSSSGVDLPMKFVDFKGAGLTICAYDFPAIHEFVRESHDALLFVSAEGLCAKLQQLLRGFPFAFDKLVEENDQTVPAGTATRASDTAIAGKGVCFAGAGAVLAAAAHASAASVHASATASAADAFFVKNMPTSEEDGGSREEHYKGKVVKGQHGMSSSTEHRELLLLFEKRECMLLYRMRQYAEKEKCVSFIDEWRRAALPLLRQLQRQHTASAAPAASLKKLL